MTVPSVQNSLPTGGGGGVTREHPVCSCPRGCKKFFRSICPFGPSRLNSASCRHIAHAGTPIFPQATCLPARVSACPDHTWQGSDLIWLLIQTNASTPYTRHLDPTTCSHALMALRLCAGGSLGFRGLCGNRYMLSKSPKEREEADRNQAGLFWLSPCEELA